MAGKCLKSMTDNLMEYTVVNFTEVFSVNRLKDILNSRKKILPPYLFERILLKSKDIKWFIHIDNLRNLLPYRDRLQWKNIDLLTFCRYTAMDESILHQLSRVTYPIKFLSIWVDILTDDGIKSVCAMGSTIESLHLRYRNRCFTDLPSTPFPKLKQLFLKCDWVKGRPKDSLNIDFSCFAETLKELRLQKEVLTDSSYSSLASLENLKALSLLWIAEGRNIKVHDVLSSLRQLRSLDLRQFLVKDVPSFAAAISKMPKLENCDAPFEQDFAELLMKCRKWKKFCFCSEWSNVGNMPSYDKLKSSADKVFSMHDETLVPTFERYGTDFNDPVRIIEALLNLLPRIPQDQMQQVENTLLDIAAKNIEGNVKVLINQFLDSNRCSRQFVKKLMNIVLSYYDYENAFEELGAIMIPDTRFNDNDEEERRINFYIYMTRQNVAKCTRDVLKNNLGNSLRMKVLRGIFFIFYKRREMRNLGMKETFERAVENNFVDEDAVNAVLRIVDFINEEHFERMDGY